MPSKQELVPRPQEQEEPKRERRSLDTSTAISVKSTQLQTPLPTVNPMFLDTDKHKGEIMPMLRIGIRAFSGGRELEQLSTLEKVDALVYAMRDKDYFGFAYVRHETPTLPKTVEETYLAKQGDCDELSRLYVALAKELGITGLIALYVNFKEANSGMEEGHAALFFVEGRVLYIDPGFEKARLFEKKYKTPEEAIRDPEFRKKLAEFQTESRKERGEWVITEMVVMKKTTAAESTYYFEQGAYAVDRQDWNEALAKTKEAIDKGMNCSAAYFNLGQAYYYNGDYENAVLALRNAVKRTDTNPDYYYFLGGSYFKAKKYADAAGTFREQVRLEPQNTDALFDLGSALYKAGNAALERKDYIETRKFYRDARHILLRFIEETHSDADKQTAKDLINDMKGRLRSK